MFFRELMKRNIIIVFASLLASCSTQNITKQSECVKQPTTPVPYSAAPVPLPQFGIGASVQIRDGKFYLAKIVPGGPASLNTFQEGDQIVSVSARADGKFEVVEGMELEDLVYEIRGCKHTPLTLKIKRNDEVIVLNTFRGNAK